ncbi:hypothetical protein CEUSTIGMA_g12725.t1 [Chlamydomonas eustigma]|uniref:CNNM transmembrane domain-containing protein n=1 Tax=Chlamydomonas eustigma TaxID=1157962 RepID=A0A250XQH1_9CHLO|nr:hypothetical protein CEUSTIGMA_g12725.t1 [Chlamydomonas eustigma]|eukprot:GAX85308.1 hypothetical protein CEUSTIGMA_g12725.t1 [Chlamydomonas eustigma]
MLLNLLPVSSRRQLLEWAGNSNETNYVYLVISILLVLGSGCMSGLTLGLLSLDPVDIEVLKRSGTPTEKRNAESIVPVIRDTHWLLVTLLLCNAACMETLPLFLNQLVTEFAAIIISVTAILTFGEILPQAICARHGLAIGAFLAWPVRILMLLCSPIAWPIAKLLDWILPHAAYSLFRRGQLKALVDMHGADEGLGGGLSDDEVQIICGALDLTHKVAYLGMTPLSKVTMLSSDDTLNKDTLRLVLTSGHSRIPIYQREDRSNIIGLILTKDLLNYNLSDSVPFNCMPIRPLPRLSAATPMYDMLKLFQSGRSHMAILTQPSPEEGNIDLTKLPDISNRGSRKASGASLPQNGILSEPAAAAPLKNAVNVELNGAKAAEESPQAPLPEAVKEGQVMLVVADDVSKKEKGGPQSVLAAFKEGVLKTSSIAHPLSSGKKKKKKRDEDKSCSSSSEDDEEEEIKRYASNPEIKVPQIAQPGVAIGITTIEDVIEELMGREILDETDQFADNEKNITVNETMRKQMLQGIGTLGYSSDFSVRNVAAMRTRMSGRDQTISSVRQNGSVPPGFVAQLPAASGNNVPDSNTQPAPVASLAANTERTSNHNVVAPSPP